MIRQRKIFWVGAVCLVACTVMMLLENCDSPKPKKELAPVATASLEGFVGSSTCQSCHATEYKDWKKSDHYRAMEPANDSTVLGDFNNVTFAANGVTNKFFKKDGKFIINTQGDDGKNHDYEVLYTFGFFPLQQYLIAFPGGRMQSTRVSWDARDKKWFHQYGDQKIHHHDWVHWTGQGQNWNTMCASCHSTDLQKNYDFSKDVYNTTWKELNVTCESCHGPGGKHVDFVNSSEHKNGEHIKNAGLLYAKNTNPQIQLNTCASCHARKADLSQTLIHSDEIVDNMIPQIISNEFYYADGQIREEDYEYSSFTQSKMFHNNVRCSNCHNPHSGKLVMAGNALCMSCHKPKYNTKEHHFHMVDTKGAECISCHMPVKTYMGVDNRRDHSFRIPRPDQSVVYGTPNTCTSCHKEKSPAWAAEAIKKWFGPNRAYHFSDDLLPGSQLTDKSEKHLIKLLLDTASPEIARATAASYLANIVTRSSAEALTTALKDEKALVRYHAVRSLENYPADAWIQPAAQSLSDRVRGVRIAAADLFHRLPREAIPASARSKYAAADAENKKYLQYQSDFAVGNVMQADYDLQGGDQVNAILNYVRGLKKDSLMNYARLNLSAAYNSVGKNTEALATLKEAAAIDPQNDRIFYNLGLLYYELGNTNAAMDNFKNAARLGSSDPGLYYNYGILLQQQGKMKDAEQLLLRGYALNPRAININYALAYMYMSQKLPKKALKHAQVLRALDANNPDYRELFRGLGL